MPQLKDLTGLRVGKLTVIGCGEDKIAKSGKRLVQWECMCDCGRKTLVTTGHLQGEHTQSCGCMRKIACGKMGKATFVHGEENTKLYHTWMCMKSRCNNAANKRYRAYGERGIKICREWAESFTAFRDWALANGYRDDLTIDRIETALKECVRVSDEQGLYPLGRSFENLQMQNSESYETFLYAWEMFDATDGSATSYDNWVRTLFENEGE